jgi:hypothetical protein
MHPDLEALIQAYDAALETAPKEAARNRDQFEQRLQDVLLRTPGLSEESLRNVIRLAHRRWLAKQHQPPTLPPKA